MKTVGSILKSARERKGLTYKEIFQTIKIHPRFLQALEEGNWDVFSGGVHAKGFLKNYAEYLEVNLDEISAFFRREYNEKETGKKMTSSPSAEAQGFLARVRSSFVTASSPTTERRGIRGPEIKNILRPLSAPRLTLTPGLVLAAATTVFVTLFFGYVIYQYHSFAGAPILIVDQPRTDLTVSDPLLNVVGRTDPDADIFLNGQQITLSGKGTFSTHLTLAEGVNVLNFIAENKLGKTNKVTRTVVVRAGSSSPEATGSAPESKP